MSAPREWLSSHMDRRTLLAFATSTALPASIVAPGTALGKQTPVPETLQESPVLAERVSSGELPPVAKRLPAAPVVVQPVDRIGVYGGSWRMGLVGGSDTALLLRTIGYENLMRWDPEWTGIIPNVAESVDVSDDSREYTFALRQGMKWSDGAPFTADDILFYVDDVYRNEELTSSLGTNPFTASKSDDHTVTITFEEPHGLFLSELAGPAGGVWTQYPRHYLEQFHTAYNSTDLESLIEENGAADWVELFQMKGGSIPGTSYDARWSNPDLPTLHAWVITEPYGDTERVVADRNPFYWKVDPEGNQLPYIDQVDYAVLQDAEVLLLRAGNGEIDMQYRNLATIQNKPVLAEFRERGNYDFFDTISSYCNMAAIHLNLTHQDAEKREVFQDKNFRIALSHAIDRQEIIDVVYISQTEPWQNAPLRSTAFFNEQLATQYTEYDPDQANTLLDELLPERDSDGIRLLPGGAKLTVAIEVTAGETPDVVDVVDLVVDYWRAVGIDAQASVIDRSLFETRRAANEHDATVFKGAGGLDVIENPPQFLPVAGRADYAQAWYVWYADPSNPTTQAEEPPEATKRQFELYDQLLETSDGDRQVELMGEILQIAADEFYNIGICLPPLGYGVVTNTFHNVPATLFDSYTWPSPAPSNPCQYFVE